MRSQFAHSAYTLDAGVSVDAIRFRGLCEQKQFVEALGLWRGDALSDVPGARRGAQLDELRVFAMRGAGSRASSSAAQGPALVGQTRRSSRGGSHA